MSTLRMRSLMCEYMFRLLRQPDQDETDLNPSGRKEPENLAYIRSCCRQGGRDIWINQQKRE